MCGIVGFINIKDARNKAEASLQKISYRGVDGKGFYEKPNLCLGHCLHSVVSYLKQPLVNDDFVFGTNCEIYNWKELAQRYGLNPQNDAELLFEILIAFLKDKELKDIDDKLVNNALKELDGVFAFFIYNQKYNYLILARDVMGEKPIWFAKQNNSFMFASEGKAIRFNGIEPEELNPRKIIVYDVKGNSLNFLNQQFFDLRWHSEEADIRHTKESTAHLLEKAVTKRIPQTKTGLLFSGGIDSAVLAFLLKKKGVNFTAYMTVADTNSKEADNALKIAKRIGFELKFTKVTNETVMEELPEIMTIIESCDPVKVEVGLTINLSLKAAKKDNIKVIFSGIGADDIFGGYKRMAAGNELNADSISNLRRLYERDLYRDDVLCMANNIEIRLPYLDKELVNFLLTIPGLHKFAESPKSLLRDVAIELGLPKEFVSIKRKAAQYSSGVSKIISQLMKEKNEKYKGNFLFSLRKKKNIKVGVLFSSGKDSTYAMHIQHRLNYEIACLITLKSLNKDSFMFHTPMVDFAKYQAMALGTPLLLHETKGEKENELEDLKKALEKAKNEYRIQGIVTGALFSNYQRARIEELCDELNLKVYSPLWHMDPEAEMRVLVKEGFKFIMTKIAADGLDESWLGKEITVKEVDRLVELNNKHGINITGEGGEFETFVLYAPMFKKKIVIKEAGKIMENRYTGVYDIKKVELRD